MAEDMHVSFDEIEMGKILAKGTLVGIPVVFVIELIVFAVAGLPGLGTVIVAGWAGLIGGTFIGCALFLAKRLGELGVAQHLPPKHAQNQGAST
ncbi:MAG TPA: hypothetical protein VHA57_08070 [Actinomycetota bacterium]|nr:hypothetical protein [Actinomycetota bacterium]